MNPNFASFGFFGLAVIVAQISDAPTGLINQGAMGCMMVWLMWRVEKRFEEQGKRFEGLGATIVVSHDKSAQEIRAMRHSFDGMTRAMLIVEVSKESNSPAVRKAAQEILSKIEARQNS